MSKQKETFTVKAGFMIGRDVHLVATKYNSSYTYNHEEDAETILQFLRKITPSGTFWALVRKIHYMENSI
jgi:hypothetical protein